MAVTEKSNHNVYVPALVWRAWVKAATKAGLSTSAYIRQCVEKAEAK